MFGLSTSHILILALVILLFGARRLPELGTSLGQGLRAFKKAMDGDGLQEKLQGGNTQQLGQRDTEKQADQPRV